MANGLRGGVDLRHDAARLSGPHRRVLRVAVEIDRIAEKLGVPKDQAAQAVAEALPQVVDRVSPDGQLPPQEELDQAFLPARAAGRRRLASGYTGPENVSQLCGPVPSMPRTNQVWRCCDDPCVQDSGVTRPWARS